MKHFFYGLAALLLLCGQLAFAQEAEPKKEPVGAGVVLADPAKIANLQLDLLLAQRKTLEVRADWLQAEQKAFQADVSLWEKSRAELQEHLNKAFGCTFDMDARKCQPEPVAPPGQ